MKINYTIPMIAICSVILSGCPVMMRVNLENDSKQPISVLYLTGNEVKIEPHKTKKVNYALDCIRIKSDKNFYEYQTVWSEKYITKGNFSSLTHGVFTEGYKLRIYNKDTPTDFIELNEGCEIQDIN